MARSLQNAEHALVDEGFAVDREHDGRHLGIDVRVHDAAQAVADGIVGIPLRKEGKEIVDLPVNEGFENRILAGEVVVDVSDAHPELRGDLTQSRRVKAALSERPLGRLDDLIATALGQLIGLASVVLHLSLASASLLPPWQGAPLHHREP